jgi:hypothetical protein
MKKLIFICFVLLSVSCKKDKTAVPDLSFVLHTRAAGDAPFTIRAPGSNSTGGFTYTSSNPAVATINGSAVTITGEGTTTITATQAAAGDFAAGSVAATLKVVPAGTLTNGQAYGGGVILHLVEVSGVLHGYIVSEDDIAASLPWTNGSLVATTATGTSLGTGAANTAKIIAALGDGDYAAKACAAYRGGNYSDWFLPSTGELAFLGLRKDLIGGIDETLYWTSSEIATTPANANYMFMGPTTVTTVGFSKTYKYKVRAFRYF